MFNCRKYNKSLTDFREYDGECTINLSNDLYNTIVLNNKFINDNVELEILASINKLDDTIDRIFITYTKYCKHYNLVECYMYTEKDQSVDSNLSENCIPYLWNTGFKNYKLVKPNRTRTSKIKMNNDFIIIPDIDSLITYIRDTVNYLKDRGMVNIIDSKK